MQWPKQIAIVGAGYMGRGIAEVLTLSGSPCTLIDLSEARTTTAANTLFAETERHEREGLIPTGSATRVHELIRGASSLEEAVSGADYVVEAVYEDPEVKAEVLRRVERSASKETVISTNTSAISVRELSAALAHPQRFLGVHWFNPPQFVPGVELIACPATNVAVLDSVEALLTGAGKEPARVQDSPGFVANRLQYALFQEAAAVVDEGIATPEMVDRVVRSTFGFRLPIFGPFAIADIAGLDVYHGAYQVLHRTFPDRFTAPAALDRLVAEGHLGAKTGSGFVINSPAQAAEMAALRDRAYVALGRAVMEAGRDRADVTR